MRREDDPLGADALKIREQFFVTLFDLLRVQTRVVHEFRHDEVRLCAKHFLAVIVRAAWRLDRGLKAQSEVAMAKIQVADTLHKAVDTAIQLCGARGYSKDTVLEWIYRYARQARLVDGASEVHKMLLARSYLAQGSEFWSWG